jgi:hypothetical protein
MGGSRARTKAIQGPKDSEVSTTGSSGPKIEPEKLIKDAKASTVIMGYYLTLHLDGTYLSPDVTI